VQQIEKDQRFVLTNRGRVAHTAELDSNDCAYPYCILAKYPNVHSVRKATAEDTDCKNCKRIIERKKEEEIKRIEKGQKFVIKRSGKVAHTAIRTSRIAALPHCSQRYLHITEVTKPTADDPDCKSCKRIIERKNKK